MTRLTHLPLLHFLRFCSLLLPLMLWTNTAFSKDSLSPETLVQWQFEGELKASINKQAYRYFFTWTQLGEESNLVLRKNSMVGKVLASYSSKDQQLLQTSPDYDAKKLLSAIEQEQLVGNLSYWLRGLQASADAEILKQKDEHIFKMEERGWLVDIGKRQAIQSYPIPESVKLSRGKFKIDFRILRAETGFIDQVCLPGNSEAEHPNENPMPSFINYADFCEQLAKVRATTGDPKHGLFGPDSMMWELNRYMVPQGFGAGRALILQISHPWVTAGIDEHSQVRDDILERARRTFTYMYTIIYGSVPQAMAAANEVHNIHTHVEGKMPYHTKYYDKGSDYRANHVEAMIWVQATLWDTLVLMYEQFERDLTTAEKAQFYEETKLFAMMFGIPKEALPGNWYEFQKYNQTMWRKLEATPASKKLADDLFHPDTPLLWVLMPIQKNFAAATLPPVVGEQYGLENGLFGDTFYWFATKGAWVGDRLLIPPLRYNPVYREAKARVKGKKSSGFNRMQLNTMTHKPVLVN